MNNLENIKYLNTYLNDHYIKFIKCLTFSVS